MRLQDLAARRTLVRCASATTANFQFSFVLSPGGQYSQAQLSADFELLQVSANQSPKSVTRQRLLVKLVADVALPDDDEIFFAQFLY